MKFLAQVIGRGTGNEESVYNQQFEMQIEADNAKLALDYLLKSPKFPQYTDEGNIIQISVNRIGG